MRRLLSLSILLAVLLLLPIRSVQAQAGGQSLSVSAISSSTTSITLSGQGTKSSAAEALLAVESQMKANDEKGNKLAKGGLKKTSYNISFSNSAVYSGIPSDSAQSWTYNFSTNYTLSDGKDAAILADEFAKGGVSVSVTTDVSLQ